MVSRCSAPSARFGDSQAAYVSYFQIQKQFYHLPKLDEAAAARLKLNEPLLLRAHFGLQIAGPTEATQRG
jgi:hypothetical protein